MRTLRQGLHTCLAALLLVALATPCYAMTAPVVSQVASWADFLVKYHDETAPDEPRPYVARQPLLCTGSTVLGGTQSQIELTAIRGLHVGAGAVLTLDNPNLLVMGPPPCITVERGGTLRIQRWHPMMADGAMPTDGMIRVQAGGILQVAEGLTLPAGMVIVEEETPPNTLPPPAPEPEPEPEPGPEPEPERIPVEGLYKPMQYLTCGTGIAYVESTLPATVETYSASGLFRELGVRWDLSTVDCDTPGTYLVYGDFIPESLADNGASNPKSIRPAVSLTLLTSTPIRDLSWRAVGPSGAAVPTLQLAFAALPADVEHLYLSQSSDGVNWKRCVRTDAMGHPDGEDFLSAVRTNKATSFLIYKMPAGFDVLYLRMEVDGSVCAGSSNPIRVQTSDFGGALGSGGPNSDADDGGSEGNRGGGQGTFDREGQKDAEQAPRPPEAAVEPTPSPEAQPEQAPRQQPESEAEQDEQESSLGERTYSGGASGYGYLSLTSEQTVFSKARAAEEDAPEEQQHTAEDAPQNQPTEESQPPATSKESGARVQPLAVENKYPEPTDDGDTSGLVAGATLAVCLFTAAGLYLLKKRSLERKS